MTTEKYDAIIIGAGQAGPPLAERFSQAGQRAAIVERKLLGGTCVNVGCIPTKTLVASARAAYMARRGGDFGVVIDGEIRVDMQRVKARMKEVSGQSNRNVGRWIEGMEHVTLYRGQAHFEGPNTVTVGDTRLSADKIFINVGGRARVPDIEGLEQVPYLTNSTMMEVDFLPEHLLVLGGGYIGLEFAQMYRRFGSRVTVIQKSPRLIPREDDDVTATVHEILTGEGVVVELGASCLAVSKTPEGGVSMRVHCQDGVAREVVGSHLLLAVGRVPNTHDLGLENAGVEVDRRGYIQVDDQLRTNVPGIWAMGDCHGRGAFTHTAWNDFEIVAANLFDHDPRRLSDRLLCYGLFIDPPLGRVGMTEAQARASGRRVLVGKRMMTRVGRARERSETQGFIKVLVDGDSREILGAAILGVNGDEAVHSVLGVMYARAPYTVISRAVHIHPTVAELIPTTLQSLQPLV